MSNPDGISIKKYHEKSLNQANKSFYFAVIFAVTGLIFFILGFGSIFNNNGKEKITNVTKEVYELGKDLDRVNEKLRRGIVQYQESQKNRNDESKNDNLADLIDEELKQLETLRSDIAVINLRVKGEFDASTIALVVVSLVGGGLIEAIAAINFLQYRKAVSQITKDLDRYQKFLIANNICNDLKDPLKDKTRCELVKVIAGIPILSVDKGAKDSSGDSSDSSNGQNPPQSSTTDDSKVKVEG